MYIFDDLLTELIQCVLNSINRFPVNIITDRFCNGDSTNDVNYGRKVDYGSERLNAATFHGGDHRLTCLFRLALLYEAYFRSRYAVILRLKGNSMFSLLRNGKDVVVLENALPIPYSRWMWCCSATGASMCFIASFVGKENGC